MRLWGGGVRGAGGRTLRQRTGYSRSQGDSCVEVALAEQAVHVRDSKDITRPDFTVGPEGWTRFVRYAGRNLNRARGVP